VIPVDDRLDTLEYFSEPLLRFGYGQVCDDPKSGLFTYGPLEERRPSAVRVGVVGTPRAIALYKSWSRGVLQNIPADNPASGHQMPFPGFEAVFRVSGLQNPVVELAVSEAEIARAIRLADRHFAIYETVSLFEQPIRHRLQQDDIAVDIWFVVVPEEVYLLGRPLSRVRRDQKISLAIQMNARLARRLQKEPSLFPEDMQAAKIYQYELNFHHQLKARLLDLRAVAQVVRESSLAPDNIDSMTGIKRRMQGPSEVAWNLTTTSYFKAGGRPWKLAEVRDGVCYVGLVFKKDTSSSDQRNACCGAQMFLDSGDGLVFKGAVGPWYSPETHDFHLSELEARRLVESVVNSYESTTGAHPKELFIHGRSRFSEQEWRGFRAGVPSATDVVCVSIRRARDLKVFRDGTRPLLRGTYYTASRRRGYLWASGYVPFLGTYPGREVPNPLVVEIVHGEAELRLVLNDVFGLTKLNFNACNYADGYPVTLRFADAVGEILTATPLGDIPPLPFRHYI
jgi:hypothetical protein